MAYAQSAPQPDAFRSANESIAEFSFAGWMWRMPKPFFQGIRPFSENTKHLTIDFSWERTTNTFHPYWVHTEGMRIGVDVRTLPIGDPKGAVLLAQRSNRPLEKVPIFAASKFPGMSYVGTFSVPETHVFALSHVDAYVSCMPMLSGRPSAGNTAPGFLSRKFICDTFFRLPRGTYVRAESAGVDLTDVGPAFTSAYHEILSFIR